MKWRRAVLAWLGVWRKELAVVLAMAATLTGPFVLGSREGNRPGDYDRRLVIVTPHHESIREEFGRAFAQMWRKKTGEKVFVDWRVPGGTSEIARLLKSEYLAAFQRHWEKELGELWSQRVASGVLDPKLKLPAEGEPEMEEHRARRAFLESDAGIGIDLVFGGGAYDFEIQSAIGMLVSGDVEKGTGIAGLMRTHPEWFTDGAIPLSMGGEPYRDAEGRWCGTCLSSFGIVFNRDVLERLGIEEEPKAWADLADPKYFGQVALADPGRSGSVTKAFEMLLQQEMRRAVDAAEAAARPAEVEPVDGEEDGAEKKPPPAPGQEPWRVEALARGWAEGMRLIQKISANARYFTDSSSKIPLEVARGDAAAGMCIDFYGRTVEEQFRDADGHSRIGFVTPEGGTSIGADSVAMLRGSADAEIATAFMEFVLSEGGQKLWDYRVGEPGGPVKHALRRLPVRRDFYTPEHRARMSDGGEEPYALAAEFTYHPEWTAGAFSAIRFIVRVMCVDTHDELKSAWGTWQHFGRPKRALDALEEMNAVRYDTALDSIGRVLRERDRIKETRLARQLSDRFRQQYALVERLAWSGR